MLDGGSADQQEVSLRILLLAGLGPYFKQGSDLVGSLFDPALAQSQPCLGDPSRPHWDLQDLHFDTPDGKRHRLLRSEKSGSLSLSIDGPPIVERKPIPNLSASTVSSILQRCDVDLEYLPLDAVWDGDREPSTSVFDYIFVSTTFICDRVT